MEELLQQFASKTILVVGDVILDDYIHGEATRISPEAPVPIVAWRSRSCTPGGAANVAANVAALGGTALLAGVVGGDDEGRLLRTALHQAGVHAEALLNHADRPTTVKQRIVAHNQQIVRLDREVRTPISAAQEKLLLERIAALLRQADGCIVSDYGKGVATPRLVRQTIGLCRSAAVPVLIDPKSLDAAACGGATLIKPNQHEAERLARRPLRDDAEVAAAGRQLARQLPGTAVLITRGAQGMTLFHDGAEPLHTAAAARTVYDVTGAGDTVMSVLGLALAAEAALADAVWLASLAAGVVVEKLGTATLSAAELHRALKMACGDCVPASTPGKSTRSLFCKAQAISQSECERMRPLPT